MFKIRANSFKNNPTFLNWRCNLPLKSCLIWPKGWDGKELVDAATPAVRLVVLCGDDGVVVVVVSMVRLV